MRIRPGQTGYKRWAKMNQPPAGEPWVWLTRAMMESPAWGALTAPARRVVDRIVIEHMHHAVTMNGELMVLYDDFEAFGISRGAIKPAINIARKLGFIDITLKGHRSYGVTKRPSIYALTWLPRNDGEPPSNRWNVIKSKEQAEAIIAGVYADREAQKGRRTTSTVAHGEGVQEIRSKPATVCRL